MTSQSCMLIMGEEKLMYLFLVSLNLVMIAFDQFNIQSSKEFVKGSSDKKKYKLIPEVAKDVTDWTVKIIVAEKAMPRASLRSPTKQQDVLAVVIDIHPQRKV
ncbi:hypothetical protein TorRG33x02_197330 [Trema orientale]|uniref:Uncharacterized protein n=1 Tax=Trema orientale TaxID=63057 RepID=A0A2P5EG67_TREOI|nr:hypothetical protein TorRG33x02_197330 [Trema orientale]